jgi:enoyl-CoA hydratase/carnithine racemase
MSPDIHVQQDERVLIVTLNRPAKRNAITAQMYSALADVVAQADANDDVSAVLIRGEGGTFTSGNDIELFLSGNGGEHRESPAAPFIHSVLSLRKPMVACVRGHAVGIGATVLLHCDYVVASDDARIRFPFVDLGLSPEFGSTLLLQQVVGRNKATEWLLLGAPIPAGEAWQAGLVNRVMPAELAEQEALSIAKRLSAKPKEALRATRGLIREAGQEPVHVRVQRESTVLDALRRTDEAQEIFKRFLNR